MWAIFHHQEHSVAVDYNFVEFDDVRVEESFHCDGLSQDLLVQHHVLATPRPEGFNSHMGSSSHVVHKSDRCKFTLSDRGTDGGTKRLKSWSPRRPGRSGNRKSTLVLSQSIMNKISSASYFDTSRRVVGNEYATSLVSNIYAERACIFLT